ncbi:hypothetical protein B0O99DRAFT_695797 [Bisporella sp. PMI_857]|nr:hypothetical protein B0O99DRAFT_695797 [Bisporella sp. PMI_857]
MSQVIEHFRKGLSSTKLAFRNTTAYDERNESYLSALESEISPACIFLPTSKEEISAFVSLVKPFATAGNIGFAIRGAGQQPLPGCANIQDGITLDLSNLTGIELKKDGIISIAAGERWSNVYAKLDGTGLGVTGSRSGRGGIGGLALEGGLSFFSSREGFVSDNVVNYEVVLASGAIVNANAKEHSDLWIALRGGSNNFGVVTRYDFETFKQSPFWGGSVYYFADSFPGQIEALVTEIKKKDATPETQLMISIGYTAQFGQVVCQNQLYYTQEVENPPVLEPFTAIYPQIDALNSMRMLTLKDAASEQASDAKDQQRTAYINTMVKADIATLQAAANIYVAALDPIKPLEGLICSLTLQPYPVSLLKKQASNGGNVLGLDPTEGPLVSVLLLTYWKNKSDDEKILGVMRGAIEKIEGNAASRKTLNEFKFMNYAWDFQDPISSYGAENKKKLQKASKKYDPDGLFQKGVPGGFKLFP